MAEWKKVVVSGSSANLANLQVDSLSSGVVTGAAGNLTTTAINGTGNIVATLGATGLIHSGSFSGSFQGDGSDLTGITVAGTDKLILSDNGTEGRISVSQLAAPLAAGISGSFNSVSASLASGIATNASDISTLEGTSVTGGPGITTSGTLSALTISASVDGTSIEIDGGGNLSLKATGVGAQAYGSSTAVPVITVDADGRLTNVTTAAISSTLAISGSTGGDDTISLTSEALTFAGSGGITSTVTSNTVTFGTAGSGFVSASAFSSPSQGTVRITLNGVNNDIDTGLQTGDSPTFSNLTVTGDLTVQGNTTELQVTNLNVEDQFILLNSGSTTGDAGIIFGGANGTANTGVGLIWDYSYNSNDGRLAIVDTLAAGATGTPTPSYYVGGVFEGTAANAATAQADHVGNIRVESGEIYIYV
jgi:hypothetical protein